VSPKGLIPFDLDELGSANRPRALAGEVVVRQNRVVRKPKTRTGFKMQAGQPVRMSPGEQRDKERAGVKGARVRKGHSASIAHKRERSLNKRKTMGI